MLRHIFFGKLNFSKTCQEGSSKPRAIFPIFKGACPLCALGSDVPG